MFDRFASISASRWRALGGLAIMLVAIAQSARTVEQPARLAAVLTLTLVMSIAWFALFGRLVTLGVMVLGTAACALMVLLPGTGAVTGVISALVIAGLRMPVHSGAPAAIVLGVVFLLADGVTSNWANPWGLGFTGLGIAFAYMAATSVRRIREERERAEALLVELRQSRQAEVERAALAERTRIAREIHDVLAHTLSALAVQLEGTRLLVEQRPGDPAAVAAVERAHRLASEGLAEARRAVGALRGDSLPGPAGLAKLVDDFSQATGTLGHLETSGKAIALSSEAQLTLYRTAQEALTNVRKHSQASSVEVRLRYSADGVELLVEDAAEEQETKAWTNGGVSAGYGLLGMRERAELLGGSLEAGPVPTGFRVRLWLPKT